MADASGGYQWHRSDGKLDDKFEIEENQVATKHVVVLTQGG
jgi:hypothetical protein